DSRRGEDDDAAGVRLLESLQKDALDLVLQPPDAGDQRHAPRRDRRLQREEMLQRLGMELGLAVRQEADLVDRNRPPAIVLPVVGVALERVFREEGFRQPPRDFGLPEVGFAREEVGLGKVVALELHPRIKAALHYSGFLLDHLREHHPQFIKRVRGLVERGQVEVLGGGYFEPILPIISDRDKLVQLKLLRDAVTRDFGRRPRGLWLAERVWEPALPRPLAEAGYGYPILDNGHFEAIGI